MTFRASLLIEGDATDAKRALDETGAAMGRTAQASTKLGGENRKAQATTTGLSGAAGTAQREVQQLAGAEARAAAQAANLARANRGASFQTANLASQFNDIGVQLAAGQNPLQLALQQGTQITQVIGPLGAAGAVKALGSALTSLVNPVSLITIGSIAAGAALFQAFTDGADGGDDMQKALDALSDQVDIYRKAVEAAAAPTAELEERFGGGASRAREILAAVAGIELRETQRQVDGFVASIAEFFDVQNRPNQNLLAETFDLSIWSRDNRRSINTVIAALEDLGNAQGLDAQQEALDRLRESFTAAAGASGGLSPDEDAFLKQLADLQLKIAQARKGGAAGEEQRVAQSIASIQEEINALRRSELANAQLQAVKKAGLDVDSLEATALREKVAELFAETEARDAVRQAAEDEARAAERAAERRAVAEERARESVQALLVTQRDELALLQASDPVQREMIRLRAQLANATIDQADAIRQNIQAILDERAAQRAGDVIEDLDGRIAALGRSARENFVQRQLDLAGVVDRSSARAIDIIERAEKVFDGEEARRKARRGGSSAAKEADREREAVEKLIEGLRIERDLLGETDPVQRELIRLRGVLSGATDEQRTAVEALIAANQAEAAEIEALNRAWDGFSDIAGQALEDVILNAESASDVIDGLARAMARAVLQAALLGQGPFAGIFGGGGGIFGAIGAAIGIPQKADGGLISGPGGPRDDRVLIAASDQEFIVNADATRRNRTLLEAINSGRIDTSGGLPAFARGGLVGATPPVFGGSAAPAAGAAARDQLELTVRLSDDLDARITSRSRDVAANITREGLEAFSRRVLPSRIREIDGDERIIG
ncbi:hypothetical protein DDZ14_16100 [Maritimibacter sp. 55A14]|uniref:phage tail length tape measure family protein n=1 Tax=Maritimibacter sp. 55A14 TaxID=2174844 RepID=UPI000D60CE6D|nr:phage tail length tape measure family protein [Maritimibacter sp. 55A14]PWE29963.1 hypothetical protein DDZ14_16100 [Maritimibacter sp. 55A14]